MIIGLFARTVVKGIAEIAKVIFVVDSNPSGSRLRLYRIILSIGKHQ
jgi:hypothetical protein